MVSVRLRYNLLAYRIYTLRVRQFCHVLVKILLTLIFLYGTHFDIMFVIFGSILKYEKSIIRWNPIFLIGIF